MAFLIYMSFSNFMVHFHSKDQFLGYIIRVCSMSSIFISHASPDRPFALQLARSLEQLDHAVWIDAERIHVGDPIPQRVAQAVARADYLVAVLSCSDPRLSNHSRCLLMMLLLELFGTLIPERLMRPPFVVPGDPGTDHPLRLGKTLERVLPHAFLFQTAKQALNQSVLLRCVGRDVFLVESIERTRFTEPPTLED